MQPGGHGRSPSHAAAIIPQLRRAGDSAVKNVPCQPHAGVLYWLLSWQPHLTASPGNLRSTLNRRRRHETTQRRQEGAARSRPGLGFAGDPRFGRSACRVQVRRGHSNSDTHAGDHSGHPLDSATHTGAGGHSTGCSAADRDGHACPAHSTTAGDQRAVSASSPDLDAGRLPCADELSLTRRRACSDRCGWMIHGKRECNGAAGVSQRQSKPGESRMPSPGFCLRQPVAPPVECKAARFRRPGGLYGATTMCLSLS